MKKEYSRHNIVHEAGNTTTVNDMVAKIIEPPNRISYKKWIKYIKKELEKYKLKTK
jgi:hypothetical protein